MRGARHKGFESAIVRINIRTLGLTGGRAGITDLRDRRAQYRRKRPAAEGRDFRAQLRGDLFRTAKSDETTQQKVKHVARLFPANALKKSTEFGRSNFGEPQVCVYLRLQCVVGKNMLGYIKVL